MFTCEWAALGPPDGPSHAVSSVVPDRGSQSVNRVVSRDPLSHQAHGRSAEGRLTTAAAGGCAEPELPPPPPPAPSPPRGSAPRGAPGYAAGEGWTLNRAQGTLPLLLSGQDGMSGWVGTEE